jgi:hypothetical protein
MGPNARRAVNSAGPPRPQRRSRRERPCENFRIDTIAECALERFSIELVDHAPAFAVHLQQGLVSPACLLERCQPCREVSMPGRHDNSIRILFGFLDPAGSKRVKVKSVCGVQGCNPI